MSSVFYTKGGACIGWVHSSAPLASLSSSAEKLEVDVMLTGKYTFSPEQVVKIETAAPIPVFLKGIRIHHTVPSYPERMFFTVGNNSEEVLKKIYESGFVGLAPQTDLDTLSDRGSPVKLLPTIIVVILCGLLFLMGLKNFFDTTILINSWTLAAMAILFFLSIAIKYIPIMANLFLKKDRCIKEVTSYLTALILSSGSTLFFMTIFKLFNS